MGYKIDSEDLNSLVSRFAENHGLKTEGTVGGKSHMNKALERITSLERIIKQQKLNEKDLRIAKELLEDLKKAVRGE